MEWLLYLLLGAVAGALAGLFGVGGGAVIVPILLLVFDALHMFPDIGVHIALGTSFGTIVLTTLASTRAHHQFGNVEWPVWRIMAPWLVLGVAVGAWLASQLGGNVLRTAIALFLLLVGLQMITRWQPPALLAGSGAATHSVAATVIGATSAFFGIGGGSLTVPYLSACGRSMKVAVGTSAACGVAISISGALSYLAWGDVQTRDIPYTTGFLYWPALLGITIASVPSAKWGAGLASRLPERSLRRYFALLMLVVGSYLLWTSQAR